MAYSPPANFLNYNTQNAKQLNIVVDIPGLPYLSSLSIQRLLEYGDIGVDYGNPGIEYGVTQVPLGSQPNERGQKNLLMPDQGSLTIAQQLEPEQGRGSISTLTMTFLDKNGYMTQAVSPGVVIPEILGEPVKVWIGYQNTNFPQDYYVVWRGRVAQVNALPGTMQLQFVDPNVVRRQQVLYQGVSTLVGNLPASATSFSATYSFTTATWTATGVGSTYHNNDIITLTGTLPTGYSAGTPYYIINIATNTFQLSTTPGGAFVPANTTNGSGITATNPDNLVPVAVQDSFFEKIQGPNGGYDNTIRCFLKIDDEFMEYQQAGSESIGFATNYFANVVRGVSPVLNMATASVEAVHSFTTEVDGYVLIQDTAINIALKLMLSGWGGPYTSGVTIASINTNGINLPTNTDAVRDLGVAVGDYITISGASNPGNNTTFVVVGFSNLADGTTNGAINTLTSLTSESPTSAVIAIRSQYDTYPVLAGCQLPGDEVDVATFQYYATAFWSNPEYSYQFLLNGPETGKTFIESEILLPFGAYSLTRQGRISMGLTLPPIADARTQIINISDVLDPGSIQVQRGINNRKYFDEVDWSFDCDETNTATSQRNSIYAGSLINISQILPITSRGARSFLNFLSIVATLEQKIFTRYATAAVLINIKVNFIIGNQIEVGDIIVLQDNSQLQIPNFSTGLRNLGVQFFEVINRSLDLRTGICTLQLEGGVGFQTSDHYATVAPSSLLTGASTASRIVITESFGSVFPNNEQLKWSSYVGLKVTVHSPDWLVQGTTTFTGFDPTNNHALLLSPALAFTPQANWVLDLEYYATGSASDQQLVKLIHAYVGQSVTIVSGISQTQFTVGAGDIGKFAVGRAVIVHNAFDPNSLLIFPNYNKTPPDPDPVITAISGNTITISEALGFVPDASFIVSLVWFPDGDVPYRLV